MTSDIKTWTITRRCVEVLKMLKEDILNALLILNLFV